MSHLYGLRVQYRFTIGSSISDLVETLDIMTAHGAGIWFLFEGRLESWLQFRANLSLREEHNDVAIHTIVKRKADIQTRGPYSCAVRSHYVKRFNEVGD